MLLTVGFARHQLAIWSGRRFMRLIRCTALALVALQLFSVSWAKPVPALVGPPRPTGILVLDNCDSEYKGKDKYEDNLTFVDFAGKQRFRVSGLNCCESIGSSHMIATDPTRKCIWMIENVANRIRRFDFVGNETLAIESQGSAISVDPDNGNLWVLAGPGTIGKGMTVVYNSLGKQIATYDISGWDIAYDAKAKAFWIAERNLTKITSTGEVLMSLPISTFCASSVDVDTKTGAAWVAVRRHQDVANSKNQLLKVGSNGENLATIDLGDKCYFRISVERQTGNVWAVNMGSSVDRISASGKIQFEHKVGALSIQSDPMGDEAWVATSTEIQRINSKGQITVRVPHSRDTSQAWMAAID
jgi:hypothetical protein